jgi:hypothetical protein
MDMWGRVEEATSPPGQGKETILLFTAPWPWRWTKSRVSVETNCLVLSSARPFFRFHPTCLHTRVNNCSFLPETPQGHNRLATCNPFIVAKYPWSS